MSLLRLLAAMILACAFATSGAAATFTVGTGLGCTHHSLAAAIAAAEANGPGMDTIRVTNTFTQPASNLFIIDQSVEIIGGYASCLWPSQTSVNSRLLGTATGRALSVAAYPERPITVTLSNLDISGGNPADAGGGIAIFGRANVRVRNSVIHANRAPHGGGIYVDGMSLPTPLQPNLDLDASSVVQNTANSDGGGVYCRGGALVRMHRGASINGNRAQAGALIGVGGGVSVHGCTFQQFGGDISSNRADDEGGAIYADGGAQVLVSWGDSPDTPAQPKLLSNVAGNERVIGTGGAVHARDAGTRVDLLGTLVSQNASDMGGAMSAALGASINLRRDPYCSLSAFDCSSVNDNYGSGVLASIIDVELGGTVSITQTVMLRNVSQDANGAKATVFDMFSPVGNAGPARLRLLDTILGGNYGSSMVTFSGSLSGAADEQLDAQFVTAYANRVDRYITGSGNAGAAVAVRASILNDSIPVRSGSIGAAEVYDCLLYRGSPEVAVTRGLVADANLDSSGVPLAGSPAIDFCSESGLSVGTGDARNFPRVINDPGAPDRYGPVDLGAIERLVIAIPHI